jgi:hypothetical protein
VAIVSISRLRPGRWSAAVNDATGYEHRAIADTSLDAVISLAEMLADVIPTEGDS